MVKVKKFRFYSDAGHGWLAVNIKYLYMLNITDKISTCSYINGATVYLEEDCDATVFVEAFKAKYGEEALRIVTHLYKAGSKEEDRSPIRYYQDYTVFNATIAYNKLMKKHTIKTPVGYHE